MLSPARSAPFQSGEALEVEKKRVFVFGSTAGVFQIPAPPCFHDSLLAGQVLLFGFSRAGDRVRLPLDLAGLGVDRGEATADPVLAAGATDVDGAFVVERRRGDRVAGARFDDRRAPLDPAGLLVERDLGAVQLRDEDHAVAQGDTAVVPAAADDFAERVRGQVRFVGPEDLAGRGVHRVDVIGAVGDVDRAFVLERLALGRELRRGRIGADLGHPVAFEFFDVFGVDFVERGEAVVGHAAAVGDPVVAGGFVQFVGGEGGRRGDRGFAGFGFAFFGGFFGRRFGRRGAAGRTGGGGDRGRVGVAGEMAEEEAGDECDRDAEADGADRHGCPEFDPQVFLFHRFNLS